jgi:CheY-like chemotaxis protein
VTAAEPTRVVFADDDEPMRLLLRTLLELAPSLELVGEAADGEEAVRLVARTRPALALLDVQMPRLDGIAAAELIRARYPATAVILHTAQLNEQTRARAAAIAVPLIDKLRVSESVEDIVALAEPKPAPPVRQEPVEALVLMAVAARVGDAVLVADAEHDVVLYNPLAAQLQGLPLPARPLPLAQVWQTARAVYPDGRPRPGEARPLAIALATRKPARDVVIWHDANSHEPRRHLVEAVPFHDPSGRFLGAGSYMTPLDGAPGFSPAG